MGWPGYKANPIWVPAPSSLVTGWNSRLNVTDIKNLDNLGDWAFKPLVGAWCGQWLTKALWINKGSDGTIPCSMDCRPRGSWSQAYHHMYNHDNHQPYWDHSSFIKKCTDYATFVLQVSSCMAAQCFNLLAVHGMRMCILHCVMNTWTTYCYITYTHSLTYIHTYIHLYIYIGTVIFSYKWLVWGSLRLTQLLLHQRTSRA